MWGPPSSSCHPPPPTRPPPPPSPPQPHACPPGQGQSRPYRRPLRLGRTRRRRRYGAKSRRGRGPTPRPWPCSNRRRSARGWTRLPSRWSTSKAGWPHDVGRGYSGPPTMCPAVTRMLRTRMRRMPLPQRIPPFRQPPRGQALHRGRGLERAPLGVSRPRLRGDGPRCIVRQGVTGYVCGCRAYGCGFLGPVCFWPDCATFLFLFYRPGVFCLGLV